MLLPLSSNSIIDLIAPGSPVTYAEVQQALHLTQALGFQAQSQISFPAEKANSLKKTKKRGSGLKTQNLLSTKGYSQNDPKQKFQPLKRALLSPDSSAIWCVRGGYGTQKLMPFLMRMKKPKNPKLLIGYSDITVLQVFLNLKWQWPALHFPVLNHFCLNVPADDGPHKREKPPKLNPAKNHFCLNVPADDGPHKREKPPKLNPAKNHLEGLPLALKHFKQLVTGKLKQQTWANLKLLNSKSLLKGHNQRQNNTLKGGANQHYKQKINSFITGGNLTLIQSTIGTAWAGSFQNKILFLEDIGEAPYRIDRALWQMQKAGVFKGVKAVLLGDFMVPKNHKKQEMQKVFLNFAKEVSFPVLQGVPLGHGQKKEPLPFGTPCVLDLAQNGSAQLSVQGFF